MRYGFACDPLFDAVQSEIERLLEVAWKAYEQGFKSPRYRKAGPGFADPDFELGIEWLETRERIQKAVTAALEKPR